MENKRGQGLSIATIILIILAVVVLVFIIYGFSVGWSNLFDRITNVGGGDVNVEAIVQACSLACNTNQEFNYCTRVRDVNFGDDNSLVLARDTEDGDQDGKFKITCDALARGNYPGVNLGCEGLVCPAQENDKLCSEFVESGRVGRWVLNEGACSEVNGRVENPTDVSDKPDDLNVCCVPGAS